jgi:phenylalanyl-tRNA synthetase beta chain
MPVINFSYSGLCGLIGREVPKAVLRDRLPMMGADLKSAEDASDEMSFEFFPDRPDLYSVEGIARALRAFLGHEPGLRSYAVGSSDVELKVDASVDDVRPHIWSALVEGIEVDDPLIKSMMDLQEKLHLTLGRNRKKVAIGLHDLSAVKPPFTYKAVRPDEVSFVPLQGDRKMDLAQILAESEKGRAYAHVLEGKERYPIIVDSSGEVLSFPPIINGVRTAVTESTKSIFVDCTGTDMNAVRDAVNIVTTALAERGGKVRTVRVSRRDGTLRAPDLDPRTMDLDVDYVNKWVGTRLSASEMSKCLMRMGHGATVTDNGIRVLVPAYRADILHPVDLAEDVAVGHGFERFGHRLPQRSTFGVEDRVISFGSRLRPVLMGLGYSEVATLSLSSRAEQYDALGLERNPSAVRVMNPVTEDHEVLRASLLPSLMAILRKNKHRELPQRLFEVGEVVRGTRNCMLVSGVSIHPKASFTEAKSDVQSVMQALGLQCDVSAAAHGAFIPGRCAHVLSSGSMVGILGEVSPGTLGAFGLGYPAAVFELELEALLALRSG